MPSLTELAKLLDFPDSSSAYQTNLNPDEELAFRQWVMANKVPYDPSHQADYDMKGFFKAMRDGDPVAMTSMNVNDGRLHFPDKWKTPFHRTFSNESMYADETAPRWEGNKLVDPDGNVVFVELPE